jgi:probable phosphomutase (TIGR03848 family)
VTVILLRHGRSVSNTAHTLAGRSEGVELDAKGVSQAAALVERLAGLPITALVRSPLLRCRLTLEPLAAALGLEPLVDERLSEVDYGQWTGRQLGELVKEPLWTVVQQQPSAAVFPDGEGLAQVQARAVAAVRDHDRRLAEEHGTDVLWVACTHGDVIKSVVADALGAHLWSLRTAVARSRPRHGRPGWPPNIRGQKSAGGCFRPMSGCCMAVVRQNGCWWIERWMRP